MLASEVPGSAARTWTSASRLQIGRLAELEVALDDTSVSRRHAEVVLADEGWVVRDLGSSNGTYLNDARLGRTDQRLRQGDVLKIGSLVLRVQKVRGGGLSVQVGSRAVQVDAATRRSWDEAMDGFGTPSDRQPQDTATLLRLMRAGYRLSQAVVVGAEWQRVLDDAVSFFGAQRGAILLVNDPAQPLAVRGVSVSINQRSLPQTVSMTPATLAFSRKESLLFQDARAAADLSAAESVARGGLSSVICAVVRSPDEAFGVLHLDRGLHQAPFTEDDLHMADSLAAALAIGLERVRMIERQQDLLVQVVTALAQAVEMRDAYTGNHTSRVTAYALLLADELGLPDDQKQNLRAATALHDIGKIGIDDDILRKPGRLSDAEFHQMRTHVTRGAEIIETVPGLAWALPVVRSHHERWDGRGYPDRLKGEQIPLTARVVAVADAFDAMTSDRPYRRGMPADAAFAEIRAAAGNQFDPRCAEAFLRIRGKVEALLNRESEFRRKADTATDTISARELQRQAAGVTPPPAVGLTTKPAPADNIPVAVPVAGSGG
ncbi:HD domain-containing phosphohydrolase [Fimbriiglobus ruber]|uniref:Putative membrane associated protein n=1 Tax=Fimbriiglobus ruber TaxID=1908690 RepID=A0A225DNU9_9BACT|nr:HD domain-containing phosphohydrolase [Fimbriiglobus ruber]OWK37837.1 putative membrane associated protein [Fimbriiglobus ruber]